MAELVLFILGGPLPSMLALIGNNRTCPCGRPCDRHHPCPRHRGPRSAYSCGHVYPTNAGGWLPWVMHRCLQVHDFHGNAANPSQNGTLRHSDINLVLSQRAQEKIDKYRAGNAAQDMRRAFLPAVVSTSGRIHGECDREFLRLLYLCRQQD